MEIKIVGIVIAIPPLSSPGYLLQWFLRWRMAQILGPELLRLEEAMKRASDACRNFAEAIEMNRQARADAILEELADEGDG